MATFWRDTNLRFWFASQGDELMFGRVELWGGPIATLLVAAILALSLALVIKSSQIMESNS
jgi:hypothetical protein